MNALETPLTSLPYKEGTPTVEEIAFAKSILGANDTNDTPNYPNHPNHPDPPSSFRVLWEFAPVVITATIIYLLLSLPFIDSVLTSITGAEDFVLILIKALLFAIILIISKFFI